MVQQVKDLVLSPQQLGSLLWHGFDLWPRNFHMPWVQQKKKKKKKRECDIESSTGRILGYCRLSYMHSHSKNHRQLSTHFVDTL